MRRFREVAFLVAFALMGASAAPAHCATKDSDPSATFTRVCTIDPAAITKTGACFAGCSCNTELAPRFISR